MKKSKKNITPEVGDIVTHNYWGDEKWVVEDYEHGYYYLVSLLDRGMISSSLSQISSCRKPTKLERALK